MTKDLSDIQEELNNIANEVQEVFGEDLGAVLRKFKKMKNDFALISTNDDALPKSLALADIIRHKLYLVEKKEDK